MFILSLLACAHLGPPPAAPLPPTRPAPVIPPFDVRVPLTEPSRADRFTAQASSPTGEFPEQGLVVAIAQSGLGIHDCGAGLECERRVRLPLLRALLDRGVQPLDLGTLPSPYVRVSSSSVDMGVDVEARLARQSTGPDGADGTGSVQSTVDLDLLWGGLELRDASSIWQGQLVRSAAPGATQVLHLLYVRTHRIQVTAEPGDVSRDQISRFNADAETWNRKLERWKAYRDETVEQRRRWNADWETYEREHADWRFRHQQQIERYDRRSTPVSRPAAPLLPPEPALLSPQDLPRLLETQTWRFDRVVGEMGAELLDARTGRVLWAGEFRGEVTDEPGALHVLFAALLDRIEAPSP